MCNVTKEPEDVTVGFVVGKYTYLHTLLPQPSLTFPIIIIMTKHIIIRTK